ncbi:MAG: nucleoside-diphosphate sugar epimerase/dehydratase [Eubacteriales bacterium]|nr:nucleoside-diphosphate sugar epimerase/dehydratase [Eubacteriales bacterium]
MEKATPKQNRVRTGILRAAWFQRAALVLADAVSVFLAYLFTLSFRFGGSVPVSFYNAFTRSVVAIILIHLLVNAALRLYSAMLRHASVEEMVKVAIGCTVSALLSLLYARFTHNRLPNSMYIAAGLVLILLFSGIRMSYRVLKLFQRSGAAITEHAERAFIIGAGDTGATLLKQIQERGNTGMHPIGFIDDDPNKQGVRIHGVPVVGKTEQMTALVPKYNVKQIIFAIPSATAEERKRALNLSLEAGCQLKIIPGLEAMLEGVDIKRIRSVDITDLLSREEVKLDTSAISSYLAGAVVLVTGGGGSIGSELVRQIVKFHPKKLVIFDIYENCAYELYMDLKHQYGDILDIEVVIGSVRDMERLRQVFSQYKPDVVFHAAAHKHVPLMETSAAEAVKNNVTGTWNTAKAADEFGVKRFVLISSDKAVNPANIMGATKYLAELVIQYMNQTAKNTRYMAVRFGNVLGSNGSVVPLFRRQIEEGGPVTVTHKDMTRYFMTIPEAAQLVIQAGSMMEQSEVLLLDMGKPVSIDQFARMFIRLSGFEPDVDIKIVYTGLRPGEKMYEELLQASEVQGESSFPGILIGKRSPLDKEDIRLRLETVIEKVQKDPAQTQKYIAEAVPTYHPLVSTQQTQSKKSIEGQTLPI